MAKQDKRPTPVPVPNTAGYPQTGMKTSGIVVRGGKAQPKGKLARGPMA